MSQCFFVCFSFFLFLFIFLCLTYPYSFNLKSLSKTKCLLLCTCKWKAYNRVVFQFCLSPTCISGAPKRGFRTSYKLPTAPVYCFPSFCYNLHCGLMWSSVEIKHTHRRAYNVPGLRWWAVQSAYFSYLTQKYGKHDLDARILSCLIRGREEDGIYLALRYTYAFPIPWGYGNTKWAMIPARMMIPAQFWKNGLKTL